ncbi:zinc transporter ZupT [Arachnia propionica]|uniref:Zinc transporter ZupT n=1 Tax=Arachnia propionica TaxID=1750 RepID=A0A3P1TAQ1_9ACTN|nr:zinc transporter ZupT [Arachnia propionica]MDO5082792.1 zinc transporter ZupT [Arachnia propionica]RRD05946.1 zinc transporter ZupT [Arachnia propionica]
MLPDVWFALLLTLLAGLSTAIGGAIGVCGRSDSTRLLSLGLGFSAGVMVHVSFVEILPKGRDQLAAAFGEKPGNWYTLLAFFGGVAVIAVIDRLVPAAINPHEPGSVQDERRRRALMQTGVLTAIALAVHNFPEGFATFISGLQDPGVALAVAVAIAIHNIPEGLAVALPVHQATGSRRRGFWAATASGLAEPAGAVIGWLLLTPWFSPALLGVVFAGVAGVMVFISIDELLPTAEEYGEHHTSMYGFIAGMAVMAVSLLLFL